MQLSPARACRAHPLLPCRRTARGCGHVHARAGGSSPARISPPPLWSLPHTVVDSGQSCRATGRVAATRHALTGWTASHLSGAATVPHACRPVAGGRGGRPMGHAHSPPACQSVPWPSCPAGGGHQVQIAVLAAGPRQAAVAWRCHVQAADLQNHPGVACQVVLWGRGRIWARVAGRGRVSHATTRPGPSSAALAAARRSAQAGIAQHCLSSAECGRRPRVGKAGPCNVAHLYVQHVQEPQVVVLPPSGIDEHCNIASKEAGAPFRTPKSACRGRRWLQAQGTLRRQGSDVNSP